VQHAQGVKLLHEAQGFFLDRQKPACPTLQVSNRLFNVSTTRVDDVVFVRGQPQCGLV
jgi:hypothetical protein